MSARDAILAEVRSALGRSGASPAPGAPPRFPARVASAPEAEMDLLLGEIGKLGGKTQKLARDGLGRALAELVRAEGVAKATLWQTPELKALGIDELLSGLGVEIVSSHADKRTLAQCDLGITGADAAFPETGTLLLRSDPTRPRMVSLLPRIHLALISQSILLPDLSPAFEQVKGDGYFVFVTGPSRTADIELTVTIGVHGPKMLCVWSIER
jgi:L-lactate dehydrogenase complex protein LldG